MYYSESRNHITREIVLEALNTLGDLLKANGKKLELVCCGGIVSVLYHGSRKMTHDVDVLFPDNPHVTQLLKQLVGEVGKKLGLECGPRGKWFHDGVSFIGLRSKSNTIVFNHPQLVLKAADWHEMVAHKLTAFRGDRDLSDAVCFLKEIDTDNKDEVFNKISGYRPSAPGLEDNLFSARFNQIWELAHGKS